jgi:hypothetical protein
MKNNRTPKILWVTGFDKEYYQSIFSKFYDYLFSKQRDATRLYTPPILARIAFICACC